MNAPLLTVAAVILLGGLYVLAPLVVHTFHNYRRKRVLPCPETEGLAEVSVDARRAAWTSAFRRPLLRVKDCSLWPKKKGCAEMCLKERRQSA